MGFIILNMAVGQDNNVSLGDQSGSGTIDTDFTTFLLSLNGIGGKAGTIINVQHLHLLVGEDISFLHQLSINGNAAFVVNIKLSNTSSVDFAFEHYSHLTSPLNIACSSCACCSLILPLARAIGIVWRPSSR